MIDIKYKLKVLEFSKLINDAQRPIRILDTVKWNEEIESFFLKTSFKEIPKIDYSKRTLKYDPQKKIDEFEHIIKKILSEFGEDDQIGKILIRNCIQYQNVVHMLLNLGTKKFYHYSKILYGDPTEYLSDGKTKLVDLSKLMDMILKSISDKDMGKSFEQNLTSMDVVDELNKRLRPYFSGENINVKLSDGIVSDASAGSDYIKIKSNSLFSARDVHIFEVHEGWVHLGTTINGEEQTYAKWLAKGPPCSTVTQEGLAVIMELFNFALYPKRARRLNDRLIACKMAIEGANVLDVIEFYRLQGQTEIECIQNAGRIFRGADLNGGAPFTKDISYLKGFVEIYNFLRTAVKNGDVECIPFLFAGKVTLEDVPVLFQYYNEGLINYPKYLPPQIKDLNGLAVWMAFSNFLNRMKLDNSTEGNPIEVKKVA